MGKALDITERTFEFAVQVVKLCQVLDEQPGAGRTLSRQLIRSGTSIGANVEEAQSGQSRADFISKLQIALKEARETRYWLIPIQFEDALNTASVMNSHPVTERMTSSVISDSTVFTL